MLMDCYLLRDGLRQRMSRNDLRRRCICISCLHWLRRRFRDRVERMTVKRKSIFLCLLRMVARSIPLHGSCLRLLGVVSPRRNASFYFRRSFFCCIILLSISMISNHPRITARSREMHCLVKNWKLGGDVWWSLSNLEALLGRRSAFRLLLSTRERASGTMEDELSVCITLVPRFKHRRLADLD